MKPSSCVLAVSSVLAVFAASCANPPPGVSCEATPDCGAGQLCDAETRQCAPDGAPRIELTSHALEAILPGTSARIEGVVTDEVGVTGAEVSLDEGRTWSPLALDEAGRFAYEVALPDGDYLPFPIHFRALDTANQAATVVLAAHVDNVPPTCAAVRPAPNGAVLAQDGPTLRMTFSLEDGSNRFRDPEVAVDGDLTWEPAALEGNTLVFDWELPTLDGTPRLVGARVKDAAGNPCEVTFTVTVDTVAPTLEILSPADGAVVGPASLTTLEVMGRAYDRIPERPATVTADLGDGAGPRPIHNSAQGFLGELPLPEEDYVPHTVTIVARDGTGNEVSASIQVVVDRVPPGLQVTAPAQGQVFNIASFTSGDDVAVTWTAADGDPDTVVEYRVGNGTWTAAQGGVAQVATSLFDDGRVYDLQVRARDSAGNETTVTRTFTVDRVAPACTFDRADHSRNTPLDLELTCPEPVSGNGAPFTVVPPDGVPSNTGAWTGTSWALRGLSPDARYTATFNAGTVQDLAGNPNASGAMATFHTRPAEPPQGQVLTLRSDVKTFDAFADPDGVVTVAMETTDPSQPLALAWFDPKTAAFTPLLAAARPPALLTVRVNAVAWRRVKADLTADRLQAFHDVFSGPTYVAQGKDGATVHAGGPQDMALVPLPPGCADPAGLPSVGWITSTLQFKRGSLVEPVDVRPQTLILHSENYWELVGVENGALKAQARTCTCFFGINTCEWGPERSVIPGIHTTLPSIARVSAARTATGERTLYVYDDGNGTRTELCVPCTSAGCPPGGSQTSPYVQGLFVASARSGNKVIGARMGVPGIELVERDLQSCTGAWTMIGLAPGSETATEWRPVMFGSRPGVLYLQGNDLKLFIP